LTIKKENKINYKENSSNVLNECESHSIDLDSITDGIVSEIPIMLANHIIEFFINSLIKLPEEVSNIDTIKNRLILTDCKLLQNQNANVLFVKGFIRKNIYYSTCNTTNTSETCDNAKHCLIHVPFECTTNITLNTSTASAIANNIINDRLKAHKENKEATFINKDSGLSEFNKISEEFFNSKPFCEPISSSITEHCRYIYKKDKSPSSEPLDIKQIIELEDNMTIKLQIHILQNCEVYIKSYCNDKESCDSSMNESNLENKSASENKVDVEDNTSKCNDDNISPDESSCKDYSSSNNNNKNLFEFILLALFALILFSINPELFRYLEKHLGEL